MLKQYVPHAKRKGSKPAFTRRNLYLRDCFCCRRASSPETGRLLSRPPLPQRKRPSRRGTRRWEALPTTPLRALLVVGRARRYCGKKGPVDKLTYDHVVPRAKKGPTSWTNVVTACKSDARA